MGRADFKRVMIFGRPGSGKSTFAAWLSSVSGFPLYHLDKYFFIRNWVEQDYNVFLQRQQEMLHTEHWIIDGNSTRSLERRWSKADLVLYFNYPRALCLFRLFKRFLSPSPSLDDRAPGCKEILRFSLLKYMWEFEERVAGDIKVLKGRYPQAVFREIRSDVDLINLKKELMETV